MPHSDSTIIPHVLKLVSEAKPKSILDIGIGWGKYGSLFRVTLENGYADISNRDNWEVTIDGVEVFPEYVGQVQHTVYNNIIISSVEDAIDNLGKYDVIFVGDIIEHIPRPQADEILTKLVNRANKMVLIATPNGHYEQGEMFGNAHEEHVSEWRPHDFTTFKYHQVYKNRKIILAAISNHPINDNGKRYKLGYLKRYPNSLYRSEFFKSKFSLK